MWVEHPRLLRGIILFSWKEQTGRGRCWAWVSPATGSVLKGASAGPRAVPGPRVGGGREVPRATVTAQPPLLHWPWGARQCAEGGHQGPGPCPAHQPVPWGRALSCLSPSLPCPTAPEAHGGARVLGQGGLSPCTAPEPPLSRGRRTKSSRGLRGRREELTRGLQACSAALARGFGMFTQEPGMAPNAQVALPHRGSCGPCWPHTRGARGPPGSRSLGLGP